MEQEITAILVIGGTRRSYIIDKNRESANPGEFAFPDYISYSLEQMQKLIGFYFKAGGTNLILELLDVPRISGSRGDDYANKLIKSTRKLITPELLDFYETIEVQPYFIGLEPLLLLPSSSPAYQLAKDLETFNQNTSVKHSRRLLFNIAAMPLLTLHQNASSSSLDIDRFDNLEQLETTLYNYHSEKCYGYPLPQPNLYIGSASNGDMKISSKLPFAIGIVYNLRVFFVPYPSSFMQQKTFDRMIADMRDKGKAPTTYSVTTESAQEAYEKISRYLEDETIWGLNDGLFR